jgi:ATP-dependent helicase/DNAse subunit B
MKIKSLSASSYDNHSWCAWKWYLQYVLGFEDPSGSAAVLGFIAHKMFEVLSRASMLNHDPNSKLWDFEHLWNIVFNHYYGDYSTVIENIKDEKLTKLARGVKNTLLGSHTPVTAKTICVEKRFGIPVEEPGFAIDRREDGSIQYLYLAGVIDRIDKINENKLAPEPILKLRVMPRKTR